MFCALVPLRKVVFLGKNNFIRRTNGLHFECLTYCTCGSVDHPLSSLEAVTDLKEQFRNIEFVLFLQAAWYRY